MAIKKISFVTFTEKENPELLKLLNAVAPYEYMNVHALAQKIMIKQLKELVNQYGIILDNSRPTNG